MIISIFTDNFYILFGVPGLAFLFLMFSAIFTENIKFNIDPNSKMLEYYKKSKLETYNLNEYLCGYNAKTTNANTDHIFLYLYNKKNNEEIIIDCTSLGMTKFYKMYELIESICEKKSNKIEVKKKGNK